MLKCKCLIFFCTDGSIELWSIVLDNAGQLILKPDVKLIENINSFRYPEPVGGDSLFY